MFEHSNIISRCSRAAPLRNGTLIDVSETAREAGNCCQLSEPLSHPPTKAGLLPGSVFARSHALRGFSGSPGFRSLFPV
jgi:hypothetical protein